MTIQEQPPTLTAGAVTPRHDTAEFLRAARASPREIGAFAPSGRVLAEVAAGQIARDDAPQTVVEIGPGSGAITDVLYAALPARSRLVAVESNAAMVGLLAKTRPWLTDLIHGDAAQLPSLLAARGVDKVDVIVSALPWSVIPATAQEPLLDALTSVLTPRGVLATVLTVPVLPLPRIRRLRHRLDQIFATVTYRTVWRNPPPARLYVCRNLRPAAGVGQ